MPTFNQVYRLLRSKGSGRTLSSRGTRYQLEARDEKIFAYPRSGRVTIHADCWGDNTACQGTRAGGVYSGPYSIYDWYRDNLSRSAGE